MALAPVLVPSPVWILPLFSFSSDCRQFTCSAAESSFFLSSRPLSTPGCSSYPPSHVVFLLRADRARSKGSIAVPSDCLCDFSMEELRTCISLPRIPSSAFTLILLVLDPPGKRRLCFVRCDCHCPRSGFHRISSLFSPSLMVSPGTIFFMNTLHEY